jgi:hypothetical protein
VHQNWGVQGSYAGEVAVVKNFVINRIKFIDDKLKYVPTAIINPELANVIMYSNDNNLLINNLPERTKIACYDLSGRMIFETVAENSFTKPLNKGAYIVRLQMQNGVSQTYKCIVE